jgi:hypothetical protein
MHIFNRLNIALACLLIGVSVPALAQEGLSVTITNDTSDAIYVTAYDRNANPPQLVLSSRAIYGSASLTVMITADASGQGHLSWTATTLDRDMHRCGRNDNPNLNDGDAVNVHADSDCG